ncbi:MAG: winged helix-turn-helix domain-containing protein [Chloroflexi bacterium]|nr:winged helix-turn-helix domain-containing protein [Chloroflexota bacterium]
MNISRLANTPDSPTGSRYGRSRGLAARTLAQSRAGYSVTIAIGAALVLVLTLIYPAGAGGVNWPLAAVALGLLFGGVTAHAALSAIVRNTQLEVRALELRLSVEASASRVLAGIKLMTPAESQGESLGANARLAAAARMATGYTSSIVFNLRDAHGVFVPSDRSNWSHEGQLARSGDELERADGHTPGAIAARQGSAVVMSLTEAHSVDLPGWAEQAGFVQGIVTPIARGLDTSGIVYVFNKSAVLPTLNEIEQLELIVSFVSNFSGAPRMAGNGRTGRTSAVVGSVPTARPFRVPESRSERRTIVMTGISMPGFALNPELERMELDGISLSLSPTEFLLLHTLASSPGRPVSPGELVNACWAGDSRPADNALDVAIFRLRRKLHKTASGKGLIKTVRGSGYMFVPPAPDDPVLSGELAGGGLADIAN